MKSRKQLSRSDLAKKAWKIRRRKLAARKAVEKKKEPTWKAQHAERRSKLALETWCNANGWKVVFFEAKSGSPLTGIIDAVLVRAHPRQSDGVQFRLVQLKSGSSGLKAIEIKRLRHAVRLAGVRELFACFDGQVLHFVPEDFDD